MPFEDKKKSYMDTLFSISTLLKRWQVEISKKDIDKNYMIRRLGQWIEHDKIIKYKDKDGDSQEMTAGAAKKMDKDHPAKQAWDKMSAQEKGADDSEKDDGGKLGGGDFDRDGGDEPDMDSDDGDEEKSAESENEKIEF